MRRQEIGGEHHAYTPGIPQPLPSHATVLTTLLLLWFPTPILASNTNDLAQIGLAYAVKVLTHESE